MSIEYGVFNAEGCIERGFYAEDAARGALQQQYAEEHDGYVAPLCGEHDDQPAEHCEECAAHP